MGTFYTLVWDIIPQKCKIQSDLGTAFFFFGVAAKALRCLYSPSSQKNIVSYCI